MFFLIIWPNIARSEIRKFLSTKTSYQIIIVRNISAAKALGWGVTTNLNTGKFFLLFASIIFRIFIKKIARRDKRNHDPL